MPIRSKLPRLLAVGLAVCAVALFAAPVAAQETEPEPFPLDLEITTAAPVEFGYNVVTVDWAPDEYPAEYEGKKLYIWIGPKNGMALPFGPHPDDDRCHYIAEGHTECSAVLGEDDAPFILHAKANDIPIVEDRFQFSVSSWIDGVDERWHSPQYFFFLGFSDAYEEGVEPTHPPTEEPSETPSADASSSAPSEAPTSTASSAASAKPDTLPETGTGSGPLAGIAAAVLLAGVGVLVLTRRRTVDR